MMPPRSMRKVSTPPFSQIVRVSLPSAAVVGQYQKNNFCLQVSCAAKVASCQLTLFSPSVAVTGNCPAYEFCNVSFRSGILLPSTAKSSFLKDSGARTTGFLEAGDQPTLIAGAADPSDGDEPGRRALPWLVRSRSRSADVPLECTPPMPSAHSKRKKCFASTGATITIDWGTRARLGADLGPANKRDGKRQRAMLS